MFITFENNSILFIFSVYARIYFKKDKNILEIFVKIFLKKKRIHADLKGLHKNIYRV